MIECKEGLGSLGEKTRLLTAVAYVVARSQPPTPPLIALSRDLRSTARDVMHALYEG